MTEDQNTALWRIKKMSNELPATDSIGDGYICTTCKQLIPVLERIAKALEAIANKMLRQPDSI